MSTLAVFLTKKGQISDNSKMADLAKFTYTEPKIYKDKDNKKWCIRYNLKYDESDETQYRKEFGKSYNIKLNRIQELKVRSVEAEILKGMVADDLYKGIDPEKKEEQQKAKLLQKIKDAERFNFDYCLQVFLKEKGYLDPIPKKTGSSKTYRLLLTNALKPALEEVGAADDLRLVKKEHILGLIDSHYFSDGEDIKRWSGSSCNVNLAIFSSFFEVLVDKGILEANVAKLVKYKPAGARNEARSTIFKRDEIEILFNVAKERDSTLEAIYKCIYYSYIRISELFRLQLSDVHLDRDIVNIPFVKAKKQNDGFSRDVYIYPKLKECLERYIQKTFGNDRNPNYYLFPNLLYNDKVHRKTPVPFYTASAHLFRYLKKQHPDKFVGREGLYPYTLKHSGATYFIEDNINNSSPTAMLLHLQKQMRHSNLNTTQIYISKDLGLTLELEKSFIFN